jgi:hypothetical protein
MPGTHEYALRSLALAQGTDPTAPAGSATLGFHASGGRVGFPDNMVSSERQDHPQAPSTAHNSTSPLSHIGFTLPSARLRAPPAASMAQPRAAPAAAMDSGLILRTPSNARPRAVPRRSVANSAPAASVQNISPVARSSPLPGSPTAETAIAAMGVQMQEMHRMMMTMQQENAALRAEVGALKSATPSTERNQFFATSEIINMTTDLAPAEKDAWLRKFAGRLRRRRTSRRARSDDRGGGWCCRHGISAARSCRSSRVRIAQRQHRRLQQLPRCREWSSRAWKKFKSERRPPSLTLALKYCLHYMLVFSKNQSSSTHSV